MAYDFACVSHTHVQDREVSAALSIRSCALGPVPHPTELCYWNGRPKPGLTCSSSAHYGEERGVAVFLAAGNFSQGGWKAGAVREGFRRVVEQPSRLGLARPDRLVIVDEFRISREYQEGYKRVNDRLPKVRQRLHRAAEYRRGIDGRARNNP
ncbi:hypothetical protein QJQ45_011295 [Haematococcus lacustris]|nr:hypothetical protein QJQ45_011295 [Haematococcus lacustris]